MSAANPQQEDDQSETEDKLKQDQVDEEEEFKTTSYANNIFAFNEEKL